MKGQDVVDDRGQDDMFLIKNKKVGSIVSIDNRFILDVDYNEHFQVDCQDNSTFLKCVKFTNK